LLNEIIDLKPGMLIRNTYRIVRKIDEGGMGAVYLADQILMDEPRALKFLSRQLSRDESFTDRFRREVRTLRQVRHKNVIDSGDLERAEDGALFFAMEYVNGPNLLGLQHNTTGPFPVYRALEIARGIAEGLGAAHSMGMVHRDIKPENILMARKGSEWIPKIADFGIVATKETSVTYRKTGGTLLTMAYAAPEQWIGTPAAELDGRTDLYALGGVMFEMLTGGTVFQAESYEGWAEQHQRATPAPPSRRRPDVAEWRGLDALVLRLLARNREDRPNDVAEVLRLLSAVEFTRHARRETVREVTTPDAPVTPGRKSTLPQTAPQLVFSSVHAEKEKKPRNRFPIVFLGAVAVILLAVAMASLQKRWAAEKNQADLSASQTTQPATATQTQPENTQPQQAPRPAKVEDSKPPVQALTPSEAVARGNEFFDQKQYPEAAPLFEQACSAGNAMGCYRLGHMYRWIGYMPSQDLPRSATLFSKGCDGGVAESCTELGESYGPGYGVPSDKTREAAYYSRGCDGGSGRGCFLLGIDYAYGSGVEKDEPAAAGLYGKSCALNYADGCVMLGAVLDKGAGVTEDHSLAAAAYSRACNIDAIHGCYMLGMKYRDGQGVDQDAEKARQLFSRGCSVGDQRACKALKE
jgi:serine/threonine-protein kinase